MSTQFALDLRLARRKTGFVQRDVAHLMGAHQTLISELEHGRQIPTLEQIVSLSLIYDRPFESLFSQLKTESRKRLQQRVIRMPEGVRSYVGTFNRDASIDKLARRLADQDNGYGGA